MLKRSFWAACCAAAVLAGAGEARAVLIDSFNSSFEQTVTNSTIGTPAGNSADTTAAIGGERDIMLEILNNPSSLAATVSVSPATGLATWSEDAAVLSRATLQYDGLDNDPFSLNATGLGGVNLRADGSTAFEFLLTNDLDFTMAARVYTDAGNWVELIKLVPGNPGGGPQTVEFKFEDFAPGEGAADFENVGAIEIVLEGIFGRTDVDIDQIATGPVGGVAAIPEPGSLALLGMGALGMAGFGWRRRKQDANA